MCEFINCDYLILKYKILGEFKVEDNDMDLI